jgi:hypothetical protein
MAVWLPAAVAFVDVTFAFALFTTGTVAVWTAESHET